MPRVIKSALLLTLLDVAFPNMVEAQGWPSAGGPVSRAEAEQLAKEIGAQYGSRGLTKAEITAIVTALINKQARISKSALREAVATEAEKRAVALEQITAEQIELEARISMLEAADAQQAEQTLGAAKQAVGMGDFESFTKLMATYRSIEQKEAAVQQWQELEAMSKDQLKVIQAQPPSQRALPLRSWIDTLKLFVATPYGREILGAREMLERFEAEQSKMFLPPDYQFGPEDVIVRVTSMPEDGPATFEVLPSPRFAGTLVKIVAQAKNPLRLIEESSLGVGGGKSTSLRGQAFVEGQTLAENQLKWRRPLFVDRFQTLIASDGRISGKIITIDLAKLLVDFARPDFEKIGTELKCENFSCRLKEDAQWRQLGTEFVIGRTPSKVEADSPEARIVSARVNSGYVSLSPGEIYYRRRFLDGSLGPVKVATNPRPAGWIVLSAIGKAPPALVQLQLLRDGNVRLTNLTMFQKDDGCLADVLGERIFPCTSHNFEVDVDGKGATYGWRYLNTESRILGVSIENGKSFQYRFNRSESLKSHLSDLSEPPVDVRIESNGEIKILETGRDCTTEFSLQCIKLFNSIDGVEISDDRQHISGRIDMRPYRAWADGIIAGTDRPAFPDRQFLPSVGTKNYYWRVTRRGTAEPWIRVFK